MRRLQAFLVSMMSLVAAILVAPQVAWAGPATGNVSELQDSVNAGPVRGGQAWDAGPDTYKLQTNPQTGTTWNAGTCADSMFDWLTSSGHKDAAIARTCDYHYYVRPGWISDAGSSRSLIGSQKLGTCVGADDHTNSSASLCTDDELADQTVVNTINPVVPQVCARTWLVEWGGYGPTEHAGGNTDDCYS